MSACCSGMTGRACTPELRPTHTFPLGHQGTAESPGPKCDSRACRYTVFKIHRTTSPAVDLLREGWSSRTGREQPWAGRHATWKCWNAERPQMGRRAQSPSPRPSPVWGGGRGGGRSSKHGALSGTLASRWPGRPSVGSPLSIRGARRGLQPRPGQTSSKCSIALAHSPTWQLSGNCGFLTEVESKPESLVSGASGLWWCRKRTASLLDDRLPELADAGGGWGGKQPERHQPGRKIRGRYQQISLFILQRSGIVPHGQARLPSVRTALSKGDPCAKPSFPRHAVRPYT